MKEKATLFMLLAVVAWSMGLAQVAIAESNGKAKTLEEWGIPNVEAIEPYKENYLDATEKIPGKETSVEYYKKENLDIVRLKIGNYQYGVGFDDDGKRPLQYQLIDFNGNGKYTNTNDKDIPVPDWVIKEYEKSIASYAVYTNKDSRIYHKYICPKLSPLKLIVKFDSPQEARDSGGKPCKDCNP